MYPRLRPHRLQRRTTRDLNFGTRSARIIIDFRAISNDERSVATIQNLVPNLPLS